MSNTIKLKNYSDINEELAAAGVITPGMLVELKSETTVGFHAVAAGTVLPMFAVEDELQGGDIDDDFAAADKVSVWVPGRGDIVNAILEDGENVIAGDFVESAGNGKLKKHDVLSTGDYVPNQIVGQVIKPVDMSGSSGADPNGRVEIRIV